MALKLEEVLSALQAKPSGKGWIAMCPVHEASGKHTPSLSIERGTKQNVVFTCRSNHCSQDAITAAIYARMKEPAKASPPPASKGWLVSPWDKWKPLAAPTYQLICKMREGRGYTPDFETLLKFDFREIKNKKGQTLVGFPYMLGKWGEPTWKPETWTVENVKWFDPTKPGKTDYIQDGPSRRQDLLFGTQQMPAVTFPTEKGIADRLAKVFIVEGQWDAMCLWELGYNALAVNSSGQSEIAPEIKRLLRDLPRIFMMMDNDNPGRACRERLAEQLPDQAVFVNYPDQVKDMCELMEQIGLDFISGAISEIIHQPLIKPVQKKDKGPQPIPEYTIGVINAADIKPEKLVWLWDYRIPAGKLTVFCGNPDVGKSTVVASIVAAATTGRKWPDCENTHPPCRVLMAIGEDNAADTVIPRLMAAGADLSRVNFMQNTLRHRDGKPADRLIGLDHDVKYVRAYLDTEPETKLIVFDPLTGYLGQAKKNNEQEVRQVLGALREMAESTGVAVLSLDHFNKNFDQEAIHRVSGSQALVAFPRVVWGFVKDKVKEDDDKRIMSNIKGNMLSEQQKHGLNYRIIGRDVPEVGNIGLVEWLGRTSTTIDQALSGRAPKQSAAAEWLKEFLKDGEKRSTDVYNAAETAGHSKATLRLAMEELKTVPKKKADGWWTSLP